MFAPCLAPLTIAERAPGTIATADPAAIYYPVGNAICRIVKKLRGEEAIFGLAQPQSDLAYGVYRGEGPFAATGPDRELRTVIALQRESFTVVARADSEIRNFMAGRSPISIAPSSAPRPSRTRRCAMARSTPSSSKPRISTA